MGMYRAMNYLKSKNIETPHGNSTVWRYMAHWKLEKLLNDSSLFFPNAMTLSDKYEVSIPKSVLESKRKELEKSGFKKRKLEEKLAVFHWETNPMKDLVLANCWSINPHESYALWKIYLGGKKNGVAIKSTVSSLTKAIESGNDPYSESFFVAKVKYCHHLKKDQLARESVIATKKPYYSFEEELRLFIINDPLSEGGTTPPYDISVGRSVSVNLHTMIKQVYISPFADSSYIREVGNLIKSSGFKLSVLEESGIRDK